MNDYIIIFFFTIGNYINYIDRSMTATLFPVFTEKFNYSKTELGLISSLFLVGYITASIFFCSVSTRFKMSKLLTMGSVLMLISSFLMCLEVKSLIYLARILSGVGEAAYQSLIPAYIDNTFSKQKTPLFLSLFFSGIYVGTSLGIILGGFITHNYKIGYVIECILMSIMILFFLIYDRHEIFLTGYENLESIKKKIKTIFKNGIWWAVTISYAFFTFTIGAINTWLPTYIKSSFPEIDYEKSQIELGLVFLFASLAGGIILSYPIKFCMKRNQEDLTKLNALFSNIYLIVSIFPLIFGLYLKVKWNIFLFIVFLFIFSVTGTSLPINWLILNIIPENCKNYSISLSIAVIHIIGDIPSPIIVGKIWDYTEDSSLALKYSLLGIIISIIIISMVTYKLYIANYYIYTPLITNYENT